MRARLMCAVLLLAALSNFSVMAQSPTFIGTWSLDASKSALWQGGSQDIDLIVTENRTAVTVTEQTARTKNTYSCTVDGKPNEQGGPASVYVRTLRREKGALLWQIKMTRTADSMSISFSERWTLSADGHTLTVLRVYPGPRQVLKVFARKE